MSRPLHTAKEVGQSGSGRCQSFAAAARRSALLGWFPLLAILLLVGLIHGRSPAEEALLPWSVERVHVVVTPGADSVRCVARFDVRAVGEQRAAIPLLAGSFTVESVSATRGARAAAQGDRLLCILEKPGEATVEVAFTVPAQRSNNCFQFTVPLTDAVQAEIRLDSAGLSPYVTTDPEAVVTSVEGRQSSFLIRPACAGSVTVKIYTFSVVAEGLWYEEHIDYGKRVSDRYFPKAVARVSLFFRGVAPSEPVLIRIPQGMHLRRVETGKDAQLRRVSDGRSLLLPLHPGEQVRQSVHLDLDVPIPPDDPVVTLQSFEVEGARRLEGALSLIFWDPMGVELVEAQGLERKAELGFFNYRFGENGFRARFRIGLKRPLVSARLKVRAKLSDGVIRCQETLAYTASHRFLREFRLRVPSGVTARPRRLLPNDTWWVSDGVLVVRRGRVPETTHWLEVEYDLPVADLSRVPVPVLEPIVDQFEGMVLVEVPTGLSTRVLESEGAITYWPGTAGPGFTVAGPGINIVLEVRRRTPLLEAKVLSRVSFEGERTLLRSTLVGEITRAPLSQLHVQLPAQFVVTEVEGSPLKSWELVGEGTVLRLDLGERYLGEVRLQVSAERLRSADEVQVEVGPVTLREATRARGYLAVVPNRDLMVTAEEVTGLLATAPDRVPKELGTVPEQALCYSVTDGAWARLRTAPVQPLARARSATILHFTQGLLSVGCHVTLSVSRGGVEVVDAVIPAGSADVVVSGSAVKSYERVGEDTWRIRFAGKVYDRTEFDIDFKSIISQAQQLVTYPGVVLVDVAQTGVVTVATDADFEVEEREVAGLAGTMEKGGPGYGEMVDGRALYGYSFERVPFTLSLLTTRLARAETVQARATAAQLTTVVAGRRTAVSRMLYFVENPGRKQYVTVYLGDRALWSTTANGIPVKPALRDDGSVLIPIAEESQQTGTVQVELIFAEPIPPLGGAAATLALRAPKLDIPVEDLRWDVYTPEGYFLFTSTGELLPYDTPEVAGLGALVQSVLHALETLLGTGVVGDVLEVVGELLALFWWLCVLPVGVVLLCVILRYVFHIRVSPVKVLVSVLLLMGLEALILPLLVTARDAAMMAPSQSNLKNMASAIQLYASDHQGFLPESGDQIAEYMGGRSLFDNPTNPGTGYIYVKGLDISKIEYPTQTILAFEEDPQRESGMINVAFLDGHVEMMALSPVEVANLVAEQSAGRPFGLEVVRGEVADAVAKGRRVAGRGRGLRGLLSSAGKARQAAWASNSRSNLKQIGIALFMYSSANDEALPVSTDQLVEYLEGRAVFANPSAPETGYLYVQGLPPRSEIQNPSGTIVMFEEAPGRDTGTNVLFLDGHVEQLTVSLADVMAKAAEQSAGAPLGFEVARGEVVLRAPSRPGFLAGLEVEREAKVELSDEFQAEEKQQRAQQVIAGRRIRAREEARKATSRSNLKQIGLALAIYANDYDGLYPQSLDDLYPNYVTDRRLFVSPSTGRRYRYISSRRVNESPQSVIAFEDVDGDARGTNLLFADGHVEFNTFTAGPGRAGAVKVDDKGTVALFDALSRSDYKELQAHSYGVPPAAEPLDVDLDALTGRIDTTEAFAFTTVAKSVRGRAEGAMPMLLSLPTGGERYRLYQPFAEREPGGFTLALVPRGPFQWVQVLLFFALAGGLTVLARRRPGTVLAVTGVAAVVLFLVVLSTSGGLWLLSEAALTGTVVALVFAAVIYQRRRTLQQKSV